MVGLPPPNIYPQYLGAAAKKTRKREQKSTRQLCLGKEAIFQKCKVIYANLSAVTPNVCACHLICNRPLLYLVLGIHHGPQRLICSAVQLVHQQLGSPLDTPGCLLHLFCLEKLNSTDKRRDTNEWCLSLWVGTPGWESFQGHHVNSGAKTARKRGRSDVKWSAPFGKSY